MPTTDPYEVVKIKGEYCLRVRATKVAVAWSKKDDAVWKSYVAEARASAQEHAEV